MRARVKKSNSDGVVRLESSGEVKEVLINEDLLNPSKEIVSVCFMGKDSSGIIDFSPEEIEKLYSTIKKRTHLVKDVKHFGL